VAWAAGWVAVGLLLLGFVLLSPLRPRIVARQEAPPEQQAQQPPAAETPPPAPPAAPPAVPAVVFDPAAVTLRLEPVFRGLAVPVALAPAGDGSGRLYVAEKGGTVRLLRDGSGAQTPFLDLRSLVRASGSEQGLLGLAFHPRYRENGHLYVNFTATNGDTVVARYTARPDRNGADPQSALIILRLPDPAANHNGGHLLFGPDGYLYVGLGDGGGAGDTYRNAQNPQTLLGKMLRLDLDRTEGGQPYAIPPDNPFRGGGPFRPEVWAAGLRNPWRYSFDRATGDFYIADVGQNAYEEVNVVPGGTPGGLNFGWPRMEGGHCYPSGSACERGGLTMPVTEYGRSAGCSITGGVVYRGARQPRLSGAYLFGDYCSGRIWSLHRDGTGTWVQTELLDSDLTVSTFGEDEAGEVYVAGMGDGTVYRVLGEPR
jgi:glucose/arabinose dehydrogenase